MKKQASKRNILTLVGVRTQNPAYLRRAFLQNSHDKIANEVRFSLGREMKKQASKRNVLTLVGKTEPSAQFFRWCSIRLNARTLSIFKSRRYLLGCLYVFFNG